MYLVGLHIYSKIYSFRALKICLYSSVLGSQEKYGHSEVGKGHWYLWTQADTVKVVVVEEEEEEEEDLSTNYEKISWLGILTYTDLIWRQSGVCDVMTIWAREADAINQASDNLQHLQDTSMSDNTEMQDNRKGHYYI